RTGARPSASLVAMGPSTLQVACHASSVRLVVAPQLVRRRGAPQDQWGRAMGESAMWRRYDLWNRAIVDVVYTPEMGGAPVYLDLDDDVLHQIAEQAEPGTSDPVLGLVSAVKPTLRLVWGPAEVFRAHLARLEDWRRSGSIEPPPVLPLLALLTLAAENMHEGGGKAANNYYGRLAQILDLTEAQIDRFTNAYRRRVRGKPTSELLWQSLNLWLDRLEGNRGL